MTTQGSCNNVSIATAKQAVNKLVKDIEDNFKEFNISEIIEAGSLGHGTAVPGHYDIDLVIYSRGFTGKDVLESKTMFQPWISKLKSFIEQVEGVTVISRKHNFSVQFIYQVAPQRIDVDLLVSPFWSSPHKFYDFLRDVPKEERIKYSVSASKWQKEFFKRQKDQVVKVYICRAKAWRNSEWGKTKPGRPKSYLMSLLVVRAHEEAQSSDPQSVTEALKTLVKTEKKDIYWADGPDDFYSRANYSDLLPSVPRIIDPANPSNNVWESGFHPVGNSSALVRKIDTINLSRMVEDFSIRESKQAVHEIAENIKQKFKEFNVSEIVKVGSLGHGTAVPGNFDVDLVIYSRDIHADDIDRYEFRSWLEKLKQFIECSYSDQGVVARIKLAPYSRRARSVNFEYKLTSDERVKVEVDIILSPYWETSEDLYKFLKTVPRKRQSVFYDCAAKWQKEFSQRLSRENEWQNVLEYIRRIKAWRNITWTPKMNGRPKSYLLTLLVVKAYELAATKQHPNKPKAADVGRELVDLVKYSGKNLNVYWADGENDYYRRRDYFTLLPPRPRVIDPANPARNVWATGFDMLNYRPGKRVKGGKSKVFKQQIDKLDLSMEYY